MCQTNLRFLEDISDSRKNLSSVRSIAFHFDRKSYGLHLGSQNMSTRILREGRKFGISGWFITQWANDIKMLNTLSQAALRIFFRPGTENIKSLAKALAHGNLKSALQYRQMIAGMRVGDFFFFNTSGNAVYVKNTETDQIQEGGNYNGL